METVQDYINGNYDVMAEAMNKASHSNIKQLDQCFNIWHMGFNPSNIPMGARSGGIKWEKMPKGFREDWENNYFKLVTSYNTYIFYAPRWIFSLAVNDGDHAKNLLGKYMSQE